MGIAKKIKLTRLLSLDNIFIFLFLVVFPFGQIIRLSFDFAGLKIPLLPIDIVVGVAAIYSLLFQKRKTKVIKYFGAFLLTATFSYILSAYSFKFQVIYGLFYLVRLFSYTLFINYVWNFVKKNAGNQKLLCDSLLCISVISGLFGWIQFTVFPDIKPFMVYDWDMHLYRLVGTFLDPTFLGLIIVFGLLVSINRLIDGDGNKIYTPIVLFLITSLAFTYSRASYLAFLGGVLVLAFYKKKFKKVIYAAALLLLIAVMLPTAKNNSIQLTRTFSIFARLDNYREAVKIFENYPVFGVGYNNYCVAKNTYIGVESFASHACSGVDSSLLLVLATTGLVGLMVFFGSVFNIFKSLKESPNLQIFISSLAALSIHSLFSNSLFYPWVMGYMVMLLALNIKD